MPREPPPEQAAAADEAHRKLSDAKSDFLSYVKLWNYVEKAYRDKESNRRFQDQMKRQFLSPRRLHEWHDVVNQLLDMVKGLVPLSLAAKAPVGSIVKAIAADSAKLSMRFFMYLGPSFLKFCFFPDSAAKSHSSSPCNRFVWLCIPFSFSQTFA